MPPKKARKRKAASTEGSDKRQKEANDGEAEETTGAPTIQELRSFKGSPGLKVTTQTVPIALDDVLRCVHDGVDNGKDVKEILMAVSDSLGILSHVVTVYMNYRANLEPDCPDLLNTTYMSQLFTRFAGLEFDKKTTVIPDPFVDDYIRDHPLPADVLAIVKGGFMATPRDSLCNDKISVHARRHVLDGFEARVKEHIACELERDPRLWNNHRGDDFFDDTLTKAAHCIFQASVMNDIEAASIKEGDFILRERGKDHTVLHQDWAEAVSDCAEKYRSKLDCFLMPIKGDPETTSRPRADGTHYFAEYNWNCKTFPTLCLSIAAEFRAEDVQYRDLRRTIWESINRDQPYVKAAMDKKGVREQRGSFKQVPRPAWIDVGEPGDGLTEGEAKEFSAIRNAVSEIRNQLWRERQQPGTRNPPNPFTLLPVFALKPAFVQISHKVVSQIGGKLAAINAARAASRPLPQTNDESAEAAKPKRPFSVTANTRLWWKPVFDFHSGDRVDLRGDQVITPWCERSRSERRHRRQQRPGQQKKRARAARAVLKTRRSTRRYGIHQLRKESWILNDDEYGRRKEGAAPHLIQSISTDGTQCNVTLVTLGEGAPGVEGLAKAGYEHVAPMADVQAHSRGVFKDIKPLTKELLDLLDKDDPACFIEVVGNDPGGKVMATHTRLRLNRQSKAEDLKGTDRMFTASEYRYASLAKRAQRYETERRRDNVAYGTAMSAYSVNNASLKAPDRVEAYVTVLYDNISAMAGELLSEERRRFRFARFRAKERAQTWMARDMAGADPDAALKRILDPQRRIKKGKPELTPQRRELIDQAISMLASRAGGRSWCRIVFFGNAQFGHGSRGPLPRKALLKKMGEICIVVLTDEYLTTKTCLVCGAKLKQTKGSRTFQCITTQNDEDSEGCSVTQINRDVTAGGNITMVGVCKLLGEPRPAHLTRPAHSHPEDRD